MGHKILIAQKVRECAALLQQARVIVEVGQREGRSLSSREDAAAAELLKRAQALEHEIQVLHRDRQRLIPSKHTKAEGA
jgi:hypothetical protein